MQEATQNPFATAIARWRALVARDRSAAGQFVYVVKTTGIYCRPDCSARLARRANVDFYDSPAEAEKAGFRPCKRCKPDIQNLEDTAQRAVAHSRKLLEADGQRTLKDLATAVGLTPRYFHKIFKDQMHQTPKEYAESLKTGQKRDDVPRDVHFAAQIEGNRELPEFREILTAGPSNMASDPGDDFDALNQIESLFVTPTSVPSGSHTDVALPCPPTTLPPISDEELQELLRTVSEPSALSGTLGSVEPNANIQDWLPMTTLGDPGQNDTAGFDFDPSSANSGPPGFDFDSTAHFVQMDYCFENIFREGWSAAA